MFSKEEYNQLSSDMNVINVTNCDIIVFSKVFYLSA